MLWAVAVRDGGRAAAFAARFGANHSHSSYRVLIQEPDIVYVRFPHPFHREQALMTINGGKPVLGEKPLSLNATHAREVLAAARDKEAFATKAT